MVLIVGRDHSAVAWHTRLPGCLPLWAADYPSAVGLRGGLGRWDDSQHRRTGCRPGLYGGVNVFTRLKAALATSEPMSRAVTVPVATQAQRSSSAGS